MSQDLPEDVHAESSRECRVCRGKKGYYRPAIAHTDTWISCSECKGAGFVTPSHADGVSLSAALPCPFCGSADVRVALPHAGGAFRVECYGSNCGVFMRTGARSEHDAIAAWNRRVPRITPTGDEVGKAAEIAEATAGSLEDAGSLTSENFGAVNAGLIIRRFRNLASIIRNSEAFAAEVLAAGTAESQRLLAENARLLAENAKLRERR
jgi:Lar family restriction alleviation protein